MEKESKREREGNQDDDDLITSKKLKENFDISSLLQEQPGNTLEEKDEQINKLKAALQENYDILGIWKEASPDFDPSTLKTELASMKTLKVQLQEARKRDRSLVMRLSTKEQEIHDLQIQVNDFRQALSPHTRQIIGTLFDPADIKALERRLKQAQDDVEAQRFTPHSIMGRKLIMKCKALQDENEDLGKQIAEGSIHKLTQEVALQRVYSEELKSSLTEANEFVLQLDQEVEVLQQTVLTLQRQLRGFKEREAKAKASSITLATSPSLSSKTSASRSHPASGESMDISDTNDSSGIDNSNDNSNTRQHSPSINEPSNDEIIGSENDANSEPSKN